MQKRLLQCSTLTQLRALLAELRDSGQLAGLAATLDRNPLSLTPSQQPPEPASKVRVCLRVGTEFSDSNQMVASQIHEPLMAAWQLSTNVLQGPPLLLHGLQDGQQQYRGVARTSSNSKTAGNNWRAVLEDSQAGGVQQPLGSYRTSAQVRRGRGAARQGSRAGSPTRHRELEGGDDC